MRMIGMIVILGRISTIRNAKLFLMMMGGIMIVVMIMIIMLMCALMIMVIALAFVGAI